MWNDDTIAPKTGFPPHPHRDMEIITYVREGAITHQDNLGNKGRTEAGDVQVMSAAPASPIRNIIGGCHDEDLPDLDRADRQGRQASWGALALPQGGAGRAVRDAGIGLCRGRGRADDPDRCPDRGSDAEGRETAEYRWAQTGAAISSPRRGRSRSKGSGSARATAPRSIRPGRCASPRSRIAK